MIVVCAIDRYFVELAGVMLASFEANADLPAAEILIVGDGLTASDRRKLQACTPRLLRFCEVPPEIEAAIAGLKTKARWGRATYLRLFLPDRLTGRILYLDADTLILRSLRDVVTVDMAGHALAACPSPSPARHNQLLGRPAETPYFNAGVLLIDAERWREQTFGQRISDLLRSRDLPYFDQDALNTVCGGDFLHLESRWNVQSLAADFADAGILHFTHAKPNRVDCTHPMRHLFLEYRQSTPWAGKPLRSYFRHRLHRVRHSVLSRVRAAWRGVVAPLRATSR